MIKLTFYSKDKKRIFGTREVKIPPNGLIIGRGKNCNIQVEDPTVSRQHAVIYFKDNNYYIKDLKSENGTFVNDKKVDETILKPNDVIGIGKYLVEFTVLSPETVGVSPSILYPIIAIFGVLIILLIVFLAKPTSTLTGLLKIDSDPQGAEVLINNEKKGITPISISLKEGSYEVVLKKDSYEDFEKKDINIEKNKTLDLGVIKLTPLPSYATLEVETTPTNAKLYINGEEKGLTPYTVDKLKPGEYEIKITKSGYEDYKDKITLKDNENKTMKIQLSKISVTPPPPSYGFLSVDSDPSGANVYVDNKNIGKTPINSYQLESGLHTIKLSLDGYNDYISNVTISSNSTNNLGKIKFLTKGYGRVIFDLGETFKDWKIIVSKTYYSDVEGYLDVEGHLEIDLVSGNYNYFLYTKDINIKDSNIKDKPFIYKSEEFNIKEDYITIIDNEFKENKCKYSEYIKKQYCKP